MRFYTLVLSVAAHAAALIFLVVIPLVALDAVPAARDLTEFIRADAVPPDPPPPPRVARRTDAPTTAPRDAAPTVAPEKIGPEIDRPPVAPRTPFDGPELGDRPFGDPAGVLPDVPVIPPPPAERVYRAGGKIRPPAKVRHVPPVYPPIAQQNKVEGTVILEAVIAETGRVRDVRVLRSVTLLDQAAVDAVRQWHFTPTLLNGEAVPVVMTVTVRFELKQ
jgi:periplasmic protein TonB